ncbi:MAG TPA: Ku protein [Verrucomicrobiae bacterium]|jgi:DNA end-binding protein Ku|nr:Ku protein [Verrucomicrobiae bacterium]
MRAIWTGAISFGLVSIPISLYPATRREDLSFRLLRKSDLSPVNYKRVAEADGKEVPWEQIVKGYEYEKGKFVVLSDEDFKRVDIEATQTVDIIEFVKLAEVDPLLFSKPYYMEVRKGGDKAYSLLRESLQATQKIAIAKVVIKTRQHLAAIKPQERGLMLEIMHFPEELLDASEFKQPGRQETSKGEMGMAKQLIESMSKPWDPAAFKDDYHSMLKKVVDAKVHHKDNQRPATTKHVSQSKVIDLAAVLQESIKHAKGGKVSGGRKLKKAA